ncbi:putative quinol monooxygenase [Paenibacillus sepulcri]|uniref:Antibiotic biosynthesis monooxygenase n=1 Tax=Paenibacillus sepulcri TaxID=359917 RepID=A0ABS7C319_9BACL|nr:antibiotic biosynthesis monooxygenase [Paenibacillus sepulcri]
MNQYGLYGKFTAQTGKRDELAKILLEAASQMDVIEDCLLYVINVTENKPETIWVTEVWTDAAAHQASLLGEEAQTLIALARPLIAGIEQIQLQTLGGKGV